MTCKTCKYNKDRKCEVLDKYLLIMASVDGKYPQIRKTLLLTDKAINEFSCNFYDKGENK